MTKPKVREFWLDDTKERRDDGNCIIFEGHKTKPRYRGGRCIQVIVKKDLQPFIDALEDAYGADERREAAEAFLKAWEGE